MSAELQLALLIVGLWVLLMAAVLGVLVALVYAWEWAQLSVRRAFWRRSALGYPVEAQHRRFVVIPARPS